MSPVQVFTGKLAHSTSVDKLELYKLAHIVVDDRGIILVLQDGIKDLVDVLAKLSLSLQEVGVHHLSPSQFIIPGFVDTHNHAPQWSQRGLGQSMHILDWLDTITFPNEARFADPAHARRVYPSCVDGFLKQGITTASYYGSMHQEATNILSDVCLEKGQQALVGKCNMNRNAPEYYRDSSVADSMEATRACIAHIERIDPEHRLLNYVLTPHFAICCEGDLLSQLGQLGQEGGLRTQTHFNEAEQEMSATKDLFPEFANEADLYAHYGLLTDRSILAHCCIMTEYELRKLAAAGAGVAHCPIANMTVGGGFMAAPIRSFLNYGIKVGLGTDSGGGFSSSMLDAIKQALIASYSREASSKGTEPKLSIEEVFYLATQGGADVCGLGSQVGNFDKGKAFDALIIDTDVDGVMAPREGHDSFRVIFEKFLLTGDDRNIREVFVGGREVKGLKQSYLGGLAGSK